MPLARVGRSPGSHHPLGSKFIFNESRCCTGCRTGRLEIPVLTDFSHQPGGVGNSCPHCRGEDMDLWLAQGSSCGGKGPKQVSGPPTSSSHSTKPTRPVSGSWRGGPPSFHVLRPGLPRGWLTSLSCWEKEKKKGDGEINLLPS